MRDHTPVPLIKGTYCDKHGTVEVLGVVKGWVVARRYRADPFLSYWKDFTREFQQGTVFDSPAN